MAKISFLCTPEKFGQLYGPLTQIYNHLQRTTGVHLNQPKAFRIEAIEFNEVEDLRVKDVNKSP